MDIISPLSPAENGSIFDSHAHFDDERFDDYRDELLGMLPNMGVGRIVNCAVDEHSAAKVLEICDRFPYCLAAVGYHPCNIPDGEPDLAPILPFFDDNRVVAVGEIGLDYYWEKDKSEAQKKWLRAQIEFANEHSLPVIIHDRDAHADTLEILKELKPSGVVHCFSGSAEMAAEILKLGMYIGMGGVLTFKNSKHCKQVVECVPLERLLLETDAPYLAPEPYRGKTNHSGLIIRVAEAVAEIKGVSVDEVLKITFDNAKRLFKL